MIRFIVKCFCLWQIWASISVILFGVSYAIRSLIQTDGSVRYVFATLFAMIAFVGWHFLFVPSIKEFSKERNSK